MLCEKLPRTVFTTVNKYNIIIEARRYPNYTIHWPYFLGTYIHTYIHTWVPTAFGVSLFYDDLRSENVKSFDVVAVVFSILSPLSWNMIYANRTKFLPSSFSVPLSSIDARPPRHQHQGGGGGSRIFMGGGGGQNIMCARAQTTGKPEVPTAGVSGVYALSLSEPYF